MLEVRKSVIDALPFDFYEEVFKHSLAREAHAGTIGEPAPVALHPLVEAAVLRIPPPPDAHPDDVNAGERFVAHYHVVDDTPPPATLAEKKAALEARVGQLAQIAHATILPPLLRRKVYAAANDAHQTVPEDRNEAQRAAIDVVASIQRRQAAIELHHGELEAQIHALTEGTVDGWEPVAFPV